MTTTEVTKYDDIIDSRDVITRIEEIMEEHGRFPNDDALRHELESLQSLNDEAEGYAPDWRYGEVLIRDSHFQTYAQELAEEIGAIDSNARWPNTCIDWDQAARELQMDYTSISFDGVTYWVR